MFHFFSITLLRLIHTISRWLFHSKNSTKCVYFLNTQGYNSSQRPKCNILHTTHQIWVSLLSYLWNFCSHLGRQLKALLQILKIEKWIGCLWLYIVMLSWCHGGGWRWFLWDVLIFWYFGSLVEKRSSINSDITHFC